MLISFQAALFCVTLFSYCTVVYVFGNDGKCSIRREETALSLQLVYGDSCHADIGQYE